MKQILNSYGTIVATRWPERMMDLARVAAGWSKDRSRGVGAVVYNPQTNVVLAQGYNGFARGFKHDDYDKFHERPAKYFLTAHAEANAVFSAARSGVSLEGAAIVSTLYPCSACALAIVQSGIRDVYTYEPDWENDTMKEQMSFARIIFKHTSTEVIFLEPKEQ